MEQCTYCTNCDRSLSPISLIKNGHNDTKPHTITWIQSFWCTCTDTLEHTTKTAHALLSYTRGQWGLLRKNSTCSSIWKLFREASNSIRAGLIAVASSQSPNHSVSQLAPRPFIHTEIHTHTHMRYAQQTPILFRPLVVPPGNESPSAASQQHLRLPTTQP